MQQQQERNQCPPKPRWRLSVGEGLVLLLNLTMIGMSAWVLGSLLSSASFWDRYMIGSASVLTLGGASLTSLVLLLRQPRLAAWFQWLAATGVCLLLAWVLWEWKQYSHMPSIGNFVAVAFCLLLTLLLIVSGRFLRTVDDET